MDQESPRPPATPLDDGSQDQRPHVRLALKACPICGKPAQPRTRPFCSRRCADVDLARWLTGAYRVPTDDAPEDDPEAPESEA